MSFLTDRKKIIQVLFTLALLLLITDIIIEKVFPEKSSPVLLKSEEINKRFFTALYNLGIKDEWIIKNTPQRKEKIKALYSYKINVPRDLSLTVVLAEIFNIYNNEAALYAEEVKAGGNTILKISSGNRLVIKSELLYNDKIFRRAGKAGFLVSDFQEIMKDTVFLNFTESFGVVVVPSRSAAKTVKRIPEKRKEYIVYLNDDIIDLDYRLNEDYSENRLKNSIRSIVGDFSKAVFFLADDNSSLCRSRIFPFVEEELRKRKIKVIMENTLLKIGPEPEDKLLKSFRRIAEEEMRPGGVLILLSSKDFLTLMPEIIRYRKIGYKFINPSDIVFNNY